MRTVKVSGSVNENHQLLALVPVDIPPGPVTVLIVPPSHEDDAGDAWADAIAREWADELSDPRQDIYSLTSDLCPLLPGSCPPSPDP